MAVFSHSGGPIVHLHGSTGDVATLAFSFIGNAAKGYIRYNDASGTLTLGAGSVDVASFDGTTSTIYDTPRFPNIISAAGAAALRVDANGYVSYQVSTSEAKELIEDYDPSKDDIFALSAKTFVYKEERARNPNARRLVGWLAEDVAKHCPSFAVYDEGRPVNIDMDRLLVKVVEELRALRDRVAALEGNQP